MSENSDKATPPSSNQKKTTHTVEEHPLSTAKAGTSKKKKVKNKPVKEKHAISKLAVLALLVALLVGAALGYAYFILFNQGMLTTEYSESQNRLNNQISKLEQDLKSSTQALSSETLSRKKIEAEFLSFRVAMEALATKLGRSSNEWRLAEIEYLLTIANHRLNLTHDVRTAVAMLESAEQRLKKIGDPALLKIRQTIKDELIKLKAVDVPDLSGMALTLGSLASSVDRLPLIDKERVAVATGEIKDQAPESWRDIPAAIWKDIKSLVVVRRHEQPTEPLLPPGESWFLYQNLRLKLEQARLSILRRDTAMFRQNLQEAETWISTFFNEESSQVMDALKITAELVKIDLQPVTPDVSGSLRQLRGLLVERGVKIGNK